MGFFKNLFKKKKKPTEDIKQEVKKILKQEARRRIGLSSVKTKAIVRSKRLKKLSTIDKTEKTFENICSFRYNDNLVDYTRFCLSISDHYFRENREVEFISKKLNLFFEENDSILIFELKRSLVRRFVTILNEENKAKEEIHDFVNENLLGIKTKNDIEQSFELAKIYEIFDKDFALTYYQKIVSEYDSTKSDKIAFRRGLTEYSRFLSGLQRYDDAFKINQQSLQELDPYYLVDYLSHSATIFTTDAHNCKKEKKHKYYVYYMLCASLCSNLSQIIQYPDCERIHDSWSKRNLKMITSAMSDFKKSLKKIGIENSETFIEEFHDFLYDVLPFSFGISKDKFGLDWYENLNELEKEVVSKEADHLIEKVEAPFYLVKFDSFTNKLLEKHIIK